MKKIQSSYILFVILFFFPFVIFASNKLSLGTYTLMEEYKEAKAKNSISDLKLRYNLLEEDSQLQVKAFISYDSTFSTFNFIKLGGKIGVTTSNILTATFPLDSLESVLNLQGVLLVNTGESLFPNLDKALPDANIDKVHSGLDGLKRQYDGSGVIVGVTDWGFDFTHAMFSKPDGTPRVTRAWITQDKIGGKPPAGYTGGSLYADANFIKNNLKSSSDNNNHGTHVLGIAAGTPVKASKATYSGVAPGAELIVAELYGVTKVSAPSVTLLETIDYMFKYADSVDKPIVVNMSLGTSAHPGDGSSERDLMLADLLKKNPQGKIIVASAGNEGMSYMHKQHTFKTKQENNETIFDTVVVSIPAGGGSSEVNSRNIGIWGMEPDQTFYAKVEIKYANGTSKETFFYHTNTSSNYTEDFNNNVKIIIHTDKKYVHNQKPNIIFSAYNLSYKDQMLVYITSEDASLHIWNYNGHFLLSETGDIIGDNNYSIGSPGIIEDIVTVGASISRPTIESLTGKVTTPWGNNKGGIAVFSSRGPSTNGFIKPDIVGPGSSIYSALNVYCPLSNYEQNYYLVDSHDDTDFFYAMSGTSMSAPLVAGVVALMLQINPKLSINEVKDILRITAINDNFTGEVRNNKSNTWGWGKIDALAIMKHLENSSIDDKDHLQKNNIKLFPNPVVNNIISVKLDGTLNDYLPKLVQIFDESGKLVFISTIITEKEFVLDKFSAGNYFIKIDDSLQKFTIIK